MRTIVGCGVVLGFVMFAFAPADAQNVDPGVKKEHEKAVEGNYKEELDDSIKEHGGTRLKEEDQKHHEQEAKDNEHKENFKVRKSGDTTEQRKND